MADACWLLLCGCCRGSRGLAAGALSDDAHARAAARSERHTPSGGPSRSACHCGKLKPLEDLAQHDLDLKLRQTGADAAVRAAAERQERVAAIGGVLREAIGAEYVGVGV